MPNSFKNSSGLGAVPIVVLVAAVGLLLFLLITNTFDFKDILFSRLFPKPPSSAQEARSVPGEVLMKFKPGAPENARENIRNSHGAKVESVIEKLEVERWKVPDQARDQVIEALSNNPNIEFAEPNYTAELSFVPNDPRYPLQWGLQMIQAPLAWDVSRGTSDVIVAVIDSGINAQHEDLAGRVVAGYNFVNENTDTSDNWECGGHGTAVSGVVGAAFNNQKGIASLGQNILIMPLRTSEQYLDTNVNPPVLKCSTNSYFNMARAMIFAADNGARVANLSMGGSSDSQTLRDGVNYAVAKGLVIAAAVGNWGGCCIGYPAAIDPVIAVGSTDQNDNKTSWSATGAGLKVMAPGVDIQTTLKEGTYGYWYGTSFSSPYVAGLAALLISTNTSLTNTQVIGYILNSVDDKGAPGWDDQYGYGRINAVKALALATGQPIPTPTPIPTEPPPTPTPTPITVTPGVQTIVISNISSTTSATGATIQWSTNIPSTSQVDYGLTTSLGSSTPLDSTLRTTHSVPISNLQPRKRYYFKVTSTITGSQTSSSIQQLRTKNK